MKIPEWVDKWIVFALALALGIDDLARSEGMPIGPVEYVMIPLMMAALFLLAFLICRALCRLAARMFVVNPSLQRVRLISNAVFFTALALIILQPQFFPGLIHETVTIELPKKVSIQAVPSIPQRCFRPAREQQLAHLRLTMVTTGPPGIQRDPAFQLPRRLQPRPSECSSK